MSLRQLDRARFDDLRRPSDAQDIPDAWRHITSSDHLVSELVRAVSLGEVDTVRRVLADWDYFLRGRPEDSRMVEALLACAEIASGHAYGFDRLAAVAAVHARGLAAGREDTDSPTEYWTRVITPWLETVEWKPPFSATWATDILGRLVEVAPSDTRCQLARRTVRDTAMRVLLVRGAEKADPRGVVTMLHVEALADGSGAVYADPARHAFLRQDHEFADAVVAAADCVRQLGFWPAPAHDLRWWLIRQDRRELSHVTGASAGLAFGMCFAQVLAALQPTLSGAAVDIEQFRQLDLRGVGATAILGEDGRVSPVDYGLAKVFAAAQNARVPRVHTVIVSRGQNLDLPLTHDSTTGTWSDQAGNLAVESAGTLREAIEKACAQRWRPADSKLGASPPPRRSPYRRVAVVLLLVLAIAGAGTILLGKVSDLAARMIPTRGADPPASATPGTPTNTAVAEQGAPPARGSVAQAPPRVPNQTAPEVHSDQPRVARPKDGTRRAANGSAPSTAIEPQTPDAATLTAAMQEPTGAIAKAPLIAQLNALQLRKDVIVPSLDALRRRQRDRGFELRADMASAELRMMRSLSAAEAGMGRATIDLDTVLQSLRDAEHAIRTLEEFLGIGKSGGTHEAASVHGRLAAARHRHGGAGEIAGRGIFTGLRDGENAGRRGIRS
jgi:hypothetical protein